MKEDGRIDFAVGIGWIAFWTGIAVNSVNQVMPNHIPGEKYGWGILPAILVAVTLPFIAGFLAGQKWDK